MEKYILLSTLVMFASGAVIRKNSGNLKYPSGAIENCIRPNTIALTFDDGPSWDLEKILNILKSNNIRATFFVLGENLQGDRWLTKRAAQEGHVIASHSYSHPSMTGLSNEGIRQELTSTNSLIEEVTGVWPKYFRPPYGDVDNNVVRVSHEVGQEVVMWNIDTLDWSNVDNAYNIVKQQLNWHDSAIILMHDWTGISRYLEDIIQFARDRNMEFVNMDECLSNSNYQAPTIQQNWNTEWNNQWNNQWNDWDRDWSKDWNS